MLLSCTGDERSTVLVSHGRAGLYQKCAYLIATISTCPAAAQHVDADVVLMALEGKVERDRTDAQIPDAHFLRGTAAVAPA